MAHALKIGKASISIRAIEKPWRTVSHNQRVNRNGKSIDYLKPIDLCALLIILIDHDHICNI